MILSIGMIIKNEEQYLDQCLHALLPILKELDSELIIVDTGSSDHSVEIAKRYTDKIYHFDWINDFSAARNYSISKCSGEWFMYLDGDEVLDDASEIIEFFKSGEYKNYIAAAHTKREYADKELKGWIISSCVRLYKNDHIKFISRIHEYVPVNGPTKMLANTFYHHYGYIGTRGEKADRNLLYIKEALKDNPYDLHSLSYYYVYLDKDKNYDEEIQRFEDLSKHLDIYKDNSTALSKIVEYAYQAYLYKKDYSTCDEIIKMVNSKPGSAPVLCRLFYFTFMSSTDERIVSLYFEMFEKILHLAIPAYNENPYMYTLNTMAWEEKEVKEGCYHYLDVCKDAKAKKWYELVVKEGFVEYALKHHNPLLKVEEYLNRDEIDEMNIRMKPNDVYEYLNHLDEDIEEQNDIYLIIKMIYSSLLMKQDEDELMFVLNNYVAFVEHYEKTYGLKKESLYQSALLIKDIDYKLGEGKITEAMEDFKEVLHIDQQLAFTMQTYLKAKGL